MFPLRKESSVKALSREVRDVVRSGIAITSVSQCVEELVYNAVDAGAKNIRIGINLEQFNVRVEDDGDGLHEVDLESVGQRYFTSKCQCLTDLSNLRFYGFRGEALASIVEVSKSVDIISRPKDVHGVELKRKFENGRAVGFIEKHNTTLGKPGTTIVVARLLSRVPVRQQRLDKSLQLEDIKSSVEKISLINPGLHLEIRNEVNGCRILSFEASKSHAAAFDQLFKSRLGFEVKFVEEFFRFESLFLAISVSSDHYKKKNFQFVFVNNRFISRCRVHNWVGNSLLDSGKTTSNSRTERFPVFILNITCPLSDYDITLDPRKHIVEFKDWDAVLSAIEGLVSKLKSKHNLSIFGVNNAGEQKRKDFSLNSSHAVRGSLHSRVVTKARPDGSEAGDTNSLGSISHHSSPSASSGGGRPERKLTRTGSSNHVVDVRAIRKRRFGSSAAAVVSNSKAPVQAKCKQPRLTLNAFNKFDEWRGEFDKPKVRSNAQIQNKHPIERKTNEPRYNDIRGDEIFREELSNPPLTDYQWKLDRYLKSQEKNEPQPHYTNNNQAIAHDQDDLLEYEASINNDSGRATTNYLEEGTPKNISTHRSQSSFRTMCSTLSAEFVEKRKILCQRKRKFTLNRIFKVYESSLSIPTLFQVNKGTLTTAAEQKVRKRDTTKQETLKKIGPSFVPKPPPKPAINVKKGEGIADPSSAYNILAPPPAPPLMSRLPFQKSHLTEWDDQMISSNYCEPDDTDLFPTGWSIEIVQDSQNQEWLKTLDNAGKIVYINLSTGKSSNDIILQEFCRSRIVPAEEIKHSHPAKYNWLRKHFPRGFKQFWNGKSREILKNGDLSKINNSIIGNSVIKCLQESTETTCLSKWVDSEYVNASKYFESDNNRSIAADAQTVSNLVSSEIKCWKTLNGVINPFRFDKDDLAHVKVRMQFDKKFIIAGLRKTATDPEILVALDQHAVHERIRLETLVAETYVDSKSSKKYIKSSQLLPPPCLDLSETEVRLMQNCQPLFEQIGIKFLPISSTSVKIQTAPLCLCDKAESESSSSKRESVLRALIHSLIREQAQYILDTKSIVYTGLPSVIHNILCAKACHGAIKFGDKLDLESCRDLINDLRKCKVAFQCAHGRPSIVPLINLNNLAGHNGSVTIESAHLPTFPPREPTLRLLLLRNECSKYFSQDYDETTAAASSGYFSRVDNSIDSYKDTTQKSNTFLFRTQKTTCADKDSNTKTISFKPPVVCKRRYLANVLVEDSPYFK